MSDIIYHQYPDLSFQYTRPSANFDDSQVKGLVAKVGCRWILGLCDRFSVDDRYCFADRFSFGDMILRLYNGIDCCI